MDRHGSDGVQHKCSPACVAIESKIIQCKQFVILKNAGVLGKDASLFEVPLMLGWKKDGNTYRAPCHKQRSTMNSIKRYLRKTCSKLSIDQFIFDPGFDYKYHPTNSRIIEEDVSHGLENLPIPCVNDEDDEVIDSSIEYTAHRVAVSGVDMNTDLVSGCDCSDNCQDKFKCECRHLTDEAGEGGPDNPAFGGYDNKLLDFVYVHGIYECNSKCSCYPSCQNRVTQEGIKSQLQVFRTRNKGWGLRCLHDLPPGFFICLYSGEVMTSDLADEIGPVRGDKYFVSLSLIEIVERKEGYESEVDIDLDLDKDMELSDSSDSSSNLSGSLKQILLKRKDLNGRHDEDDGKKQKVEAATPKEEVQSGTPFLPVRDYLVKSKEDSIQMNPDNTGREVYVVDANKKGNVGRFLNHSCEPNCHLQNVFSDTHDPRFPVLAFFTLRHIKALDELTWDYHYSDAHGDVFHCHCGSNKCKSRRRDTP